MSGIVPKTNTGITYFKHKDHIQRGSPSLHTEQKAIYGTIVDILYPSPNNPGIFVKVVWDTYPSDETPFRLMGEIPEGMLSSIGNKDAIVLKKLRVKYAWKGVNWRKGLAWLMCDNMQDNTIVNYQKNKASSFGGVTAGLAANTRAAGF
jgi:hypothetical protein